MLTHEMLKKELEKSGYTLIAFDDNGEKKISSTLHGIAPLAELCEKNVENTKLWVADKVTGKAAALLCVQANVVSLYTHVITKTAKKILSSNKIDFSYETCVDYIKNRTNTGKCPMESLSQNVDSPVEMLEKVRKFLDEL